MSGSVAKRRRTKSSRKGFPVRLYKPRWHMLLAAMHYQSYTYEVVDEESFHDLFEFVSEKIEFDMCVSGTKTVRIRSKHVPAMIEALEFAIRLHQSNGYGGQTYPSSASNQFKRELDSLRAVPAIDLLGDSAR
jgi:hypothetical protein